MTLGNGYEGVNESRRALGSLRRIGKSLVLGKLVIGNRVCYFPRVFFNNISVEDSVANPSLSSKNLREALVRNASELKMAV